MPAAAADLQRGRILYALFPFASAFPVELADGTSYGTVEQLASAQGGRPAKLVVAARLRPVLLLHDGTRGPHGDIVCLRVNTVKPALKARAQTWRRIVEQEHPWFFHLPAGVRRYGLREESVIAVNSIGTVNKNALMGPPVGGLAHGELQALNERLARALQLDLAPLVAARARELLERAGLGPV